MEKNINKAYATIASLKILNELDNRKFTSESPELVFGLKEAIENILMEVYYGCYESNNDDDLEENKEQYE